MAPTESRPSFDLTVIGAGPGGYVAAIRAAQLGLKVAIVERDALGGVCLNWGCIPTKALLRRAEQYEFLKEASGVGFSFSGLDYDWARLIETSREAATKLSGGVAFLMKKNKIEVFAGAARFRSAHRIEVRDAAGTVSAEIQTRHTIIATGARPIVLPGLEVDGRRILTSREALELPEQPRRVTIIGAGAIGLEFAYFFSAFGSEVTVVEAAPGILPTADAEISSALGRSFKKRKVRLLESYRVENVEVAGDTVTTRAVAWGADGPTGKEVSLESDVLLCAIGVRGNVKGLGLEAAGVQSERGFIPVDEYGRTSLREIYAIGDITGPPALAHAASAAALQAVRHIAGERPAPIDPLAIPACIYCQPQVAQVGLTEAQAEAAGHAVKVGRFPFSANGKAVAVGEAQGFVKIVASESGELLGAHIIGPEATELIAELVLAQAGELGVEALHQTVHAHPTLSESVMEAAADWAGEVTGI